MVETRFPGVYWNPARWHMTADGYIPFRVFDLYAAALFPTLAMDRLNTAQAIGMVMAEKAAGERLWTATWREAYPREE